MTGFVTGIKQLASFNNALPKSYKETQQRTKNNDTISQADIWSSGFYTIEQKPFAFREVGRLISTALEGNG